MEIEKCCPTYAKQAETNLVYISILRKVMVLLSKSMLFQVAAQVPVGIPSKGWGAGVYINME